MPAGDAQPGWTVGSLIGVPVGSSGAGSPVGPVGPPAPPPAPGEAIAPQEAAGWVVLGGEIGQGASARAFRPDGVEALTYGNPFGQVVERAWFDGKVVFALDVGEVAVDPARVKVAQEYQIVYAVELDEAGKLRRDPELVAGQLNIYDSTPGMPEYSPIWQFNYVVVPRDYEPNTLRSAQACEQSGYPVRRSQVFEN